MGHKNPGLRLLLKNEKIGQRWVHIPSWATAWPAPVEQQLFWLQRGHGTAPSVHKPPLHRFSFLSHWWLRLPVSAPCRHWGLPCLHCLRDLKLSAFKLYFFSPSPTIQCVWCPLVALWHPSGPRKPQIMLLGEAELSLMWPECSFYSWSSRRPEAQTH